MLALGREMLELIKSRQEKLNGFAKGGLAYR